MPSGETIIHISDQIVVHEQSSSVMRAIFKANPLMVAKKYLDGCWRVLTEPDRVRARTQYKSVYGVSYVAPSENIVDNSALIDENRQLKAKLAAYESRKVEAAKRVADVTASKKTRKK